MKESALRMLVCPRTQTQLTVEIFAAEGQEIIDGALESARGDLYPIIRGVPRMLPPALRKHLADDYPEYFAKYGHCLRASSTDPNDHAPVRRQTQEAFGHEWTWAADYDAQNFDDWLPQGFTRSGLLSGRTGLEVGCGAGRHASATAQIAKEHFAVDLSRAVDSAFATNRDRNNCHVIQADAFHLPFRPGSFDYVYCLGVLQHMHDPPRGFRSLAEQPRKGGILLVNVYQAGRPLTVGLLAWVRKVSTRMSNRQLQIASEVAGNLEYACLTWPWKQLKGTRAGRLLAPLVPTRLDEYSRHTRRTAVVDWFDRLSCPVKLHYTREQLAAWYCSSGYTSVTVTPYWKAFWNGYGERMSLQGDTREPARAGHTGARPAALK